MEGKKNRKRWAAFPFKVTSRIWLDSSSGLFSFKKPSPAVKLNYS